MMRPARGIARFRSAERAERAGLVAPSRSPPLHFRQKKKRMSDKEASALEMHMEDHVMSRDGRAVPVMSRQPAEVGAGSASTGW